ncbi:MAG: hypothetical protein COC14_10530 [Burkholderiaceae bacterium]|uniref:Uncharacterized protein n=1 Tax=Cupriavidus metallidurans TaxID=119219 RepID=A0A482IVU9_9BURK|nr:MULTISPECIES: hypothetical protein [Cupriavidus]PCH54870.1 MAG: hypothetical protein COC14_10530 [Burkholderiaceae bacterium]QBP13215.1 hypothetical protein DDF84_026625 [Cupriavidus metallidurans]QWC91021.1 hypothetical protein KB891_26300 [Cupriavidus metallidurans]
MSTKARNRQENLPYSADCRWPFCPIIATVPDLAEQPRPLQPAPGHEHQLSRGVRVFFLQRDLSRAGKINGSKGQSGKGGFCLAKPETRA